MRILLLGADGQLGRHLRRALSDLAHVSPAPPDLDITETRLLVAALDADEPDVIVNAAAWTDVDGAESEAVRAGAVNAGAVEALARWSKHHSAGVVHFSTDFVFDGRKAAPYTEEDVPNPLNVYGRTKLAGERALLEEVGAAVVLRTSWVWSLAAKSFVSTMLRLARERETLRVVSDQIGSPTHARDLADATASMLRTMRVRPREALERARGVYHVAGTGCCSRYELARAALALDHRKHEHACREIEPVASTSCPALAVRPAQSALDCSKFRAEFGLQLPHWRDTLNAVLERGTD